MSGGKAKEPTLGEELKALEDLVRRLESDGIDLDEALRLFEEGIARLRRARGPGAQPPLPGRSRGRRLRSVPARPAAPGPGPGGAQGRPMTAARMRAVR